MRLRLEVCIACVNSGYNTPAAFGNYASIGGVWHHFVTLGLLR